MQSVFETARITIRKLCAENLKRRAMPYRLNYLPIFFQNLCPIFHTGLANKLNGECLSGGNRFCFVPRNIPPQTSTSSHLIESTSQDLECPSYEQYLTSATLPSGCRATGNTQVPSSAWTSKEFLSLITRPKPSPHDHWHYYLRRQEEKT
ncbi:hypothetical protein M378DRAFT_668822 [Amanita muscaria Koide BX008]|uniref:Uncharacterized protein n=1 Tax=Amanita muscaria (strain Koide BX008) TaxID=946122 RepID=A0A0C2SJM9_AMAMK|nr:hypothetical protein M378DRAFT_668822 [Amanita muscaria Koide BX008]